MADPHFVARGFPVEIEHPELDRTFTYPGAPYRFTATPWSRPARPAARRAPIRPRLTSSPIRVWKVIGVSEGRKTDRPHSDA